MYVHIQLSALQLVEVLTVADPEFVSGLAPTPSPNPVSAVLGDTVAGSDSLAILYPIGKDGGQAISSTGNPALDGLTFPLTQIPGIGTTAIGDLSGNVALSITDFNLFRINVINGFNILDQKIRDILAVQEPTCPA